MLTKFIESRYQNLTIYQGQQLICQQEGQEHISLPYRFPAEQTE